MQYDIQVKRETKKKHFCFNKFLYNILKWNINKKQIGNCNRIVEEFTLYWRAKVSKFHDTLFSIEIRRIRSVSHW